MSFFHSKTPEERAQDGQRRRQEDALKALTAKNNAEAKQRQMVDLARIANGGIPSEAERRLRELAQAKAGDVAFTSDLTPDEAGLLRRRGLTALGLVTGSSVYHVGIAYVSSWTDNEVQALSNAYMDATKRAVDRMTQEARLLGAHGVIGVRYRMVRREWSDKLVEVQLLGTAIRGDGPAPKEPFTSDLSGQEWWALTRAGYEPAGLVWGHCTWFIVTQQTDEWTQSSFRNQELRHFSMALHRCRDLAQRRMHDLAQHLGAVGVVGVHTERRLQEVHLSGSGTTADEREHHNLTLSLIGTAIRDHKGAATLVHATVPVISLRDGKLRMTSGRIAEASFE